ncbi:MAG: cobyrinate a,c-diamide synthase, partial [Colwellia sp.]
MKPCLCPALILAAPASGQGKTTITAGLASMLKRQGKIVRIFKVGPDYLDPKILRQASGQPVEPLDLWMAGLDYCQDKMYQAAQVADIILIEGAMGIFDGKPSSADLAAQFDIPVAIVMDVKGMAQTAAAIAMGLASYRDDFTCAGLIANNCASERHAQLIRDALSPSLPLLATLKRASEVSLPERHLGLVQAEEMAEELQERLDAGADWVAESQLKYLLDKIPPVTFKPPSKRIPSNQSLMGKTIAIAKDKAFSFIYDANLQVLNDLGASYVFFSPLHDQAIPDADALWLPGGYPELHAVQLAANTVMRQSIKRFAQENKPVLAECGGFLYCLDSLTDLNKQHHLMLGLIPGEGQMRTRGGCQGMQTAVLPEGDFRGHSHHRSISSKTPEPIAFGRRPYHPAPGEAIYRVGSVTAS